MDIERARFNMVEQQIRPWDVLDQDVLDLLFVVRREEYVPPAYRSLAFTDMEIPLTVDGSPGELQQVFTNLVMNSIDALAPGGGGRIRLTASRAAGQAVVEVEDDGPGIPDDKLAAIFEPFVTTKQGNGGTGLGLSISRGIVEQHGGSISVENLAGGCRFTVRLPLAAETPA